MFKRFFVACVCLALVQWPVLGGAETKAPSLSLSEILHRNAAARGGAEAWRSVRSMSMAGEMDAGHGTKLPYVLSLKRPHKMRLDLQFQGKTAVQVYDGVHGWKLRPFLNRNVAEMMSPEDVSAAATQAELDGMLIDHSAKGYRLQLLGRETIKGRDAYKLEVTMPGGIVRHVWVDATTFLEIKVDGKRRMDSAYRTIETYLRDYKLESGLLVPHVLETATEGIKETQTLTVNSVTLNPTIDDSRFAYP